MGSSESKSTIKNENNTLIVNKSDIEIVNKQLNEMSTNVAVNNAKSCSSSVNLEQVIDFSGAHIKGDFNIGTDGKGNAGKVSLKQENVATFKCVQSTTVANEIGQNMLNDMMAKIDSSVSNEALNKMVANADSKAETGALSFGGSSNSESNVENINNYKSITETKKKLENIVQNSISSNFTADDAQECINQVNQKQGIDGSGALIEGSVNIANFEADQVSNIFAECVQKSNVGSKITTDIANNMGVEIKEDSSTKLTNDMEGTATSSAKTTGLGLDMFGSLGSITGSLGSLGLAAFAPILIPCILICCVCCCIASSSVIPAMMKMAKGSQSGGAVSYIGSEYFDTVSSLKDEAPKKIPMATPFPFN